MKRFWVLVIALIFLIGAAGCGSGNSNENKSPESAGGQVTQNVAGGGSEQTGSESGGGGLSADAEKGSANAANNDGKTVDNTTDKTADGLGNSEATDNAVGGATEESDTVPASAPAAQTKPAQQTPGGSQAQLWVTQDFSGTVLLNKQISVDRNTSVLDIVKSNLEVDTAYGGGFINAISGLQSGYTGKLFGGRKMDWFYWVNGIMVAEGAGDYIPMAGDRIWWDYHDWGSGSFVSAVVGAYPQPFVNGFDGRSDGTVVAYAPGYEAEAGRIADALRAKGAKGVTTSLLAGIDPGKRNKMTVVVGLWSDLEKNSFFTGLNENSRKTGIYVDFAANGFTALDFERKDAGVYKAGAGAITATGRGLGDRNPLWLVTGVDKAGLNSAVKVITDRSEQLSREVGVLVVGDKVQALPAER